jgi:hypothetical protein
LHPPYARYTHLPLRDKQVAGAEIKISERGERAHLSRQ